jgi:hypothetical protein
MPTMVSVHHSLEEWLHTSHSVRNQIEPVVIGDEVKTTDRILENIQLTSTELLDVLTEIFGAPVFSSGYRCTALNKIVGGATSSAHLYGCAADLRWTEWQLSEVVQVAVDSGLPFDKLILEVRGPTHWLHVQGAEADGIPRRELIYSPEAATYLPQSLDQMLALGF